MISVIIPVYNLEGEIGRTLDSVCGQSYGNLQIVVVNDGSRDCSLDVCREYAARDRRICLIDKPNGGLPLARETGLEAAVGSMSIISTGGMCSSPTLTVRLWKPCRQAENPICALRFLL